jgi:CPA2 family monovalent cation:H+ antiporter-2
VEAEPPDLAAAKGTVIIIGFGRIGRLVADMLTAHGKPYLAVESDIDAVVDARRDGHRILFGDVSRPQFIEQLKLDHAGALVLTMDDPVLTVRTTRRVRAAHPQLTIVARARDAAHAAELYRAGASDAVPETLESSLQLSEALLVDLGIAMGPVIASIHEKRAEFRAEIMQQAELEREPPLRRRQLSDTS